MPDFTDPSTQNPQAPATIDPPTAAITDPAAPAANDAPTGLDPTTPPGAPSAPEDKNAWPGIARFVEENRHHLPPAAGPKPPAPSSMQDSARPGRAAPDHLGLPHPGGGYMTSRLISRAMDDLAVLTQGKRAGTPADAREAFGQALLAENVAPRGYSAEDAVGWWQAGGTVARHPTAPETSQSEAASGNNLPVGMPASTSTPNTSSNGNIGETPATNLGSPPQSTITSESKAANPGAPLVNTRINTPGSPPTPASNQPPITQASNTNTTGSPSQAAATPATRQNGAPAASNGPVQTAATAPTQPFVPLKTGRVGDDFVIAARVDKKNFSRLSGQDIVATPEIKKAALDNIARFAVAAGKDEILGYGYLMPNGTIEIRMVKKGAAGWSHRGKPSGPGKPLFGIHGHPANGEGMVDDPSLNHNFGDTAELKWDKIPMATVFNGKIGWHEMTKGQLTFTAPRGSVQDDESSRLQDNLDKSQNNFLAIKEKRKKLNR